MDVVIIGGGQAGLQTCASLRDNGFGGGITLVCDEKTPPYQRPPLSKAYLAGDGDVALRPDSFYESANIAIVHNSATAIDRHRRQITLDNGHRRGYDRLVLATGARPRLLPVPGARLNGIIALRTLVDAYALRRQLAQCRHLVIVGGGFIGLEVAAAARKLGVDTTVVETLPRTMARVVSAPMAARLTEEHRRHGTRFLLGRLVTAFDGDATGHVRKAVLDDGTRLDADLVVVGAGVVPNVELALTAGLAADDGVVVDEYLRTGDAAVYAIGDCANFPSRHAAGRVRLESVQNAVDHAHCVAAAIVGNPYAYDAVPWFWSDQHGIKLQIAGISTGHDRTVISGDVGAGRFSIYCFQQGTLIAVESANKPADHVLSRRLLAGKPDLTPDEVAEPGFDLKPRALAAAR